MARNVGVIVVSLSLVFVARTAQAATVTYNALAGYQASTGTTVLDTYDVGYDHGDVVDQPLNDVHTDAHMSGVLGETDYKATGNPNVNIVESQGTNANYCAGCNGSFELIFTSTSVGPASGVFGVGLNFENFIPTVLYHAFVTFGNGTTADFALPFNADLTAFWGITSDLAINKIDFGLPNGGATNNGGFLIDDLRISAAPTAAVPEPTSIVLLGSGVATLLIRRRRRN
jgi:hypothetical protein